jgi:hypothetical protein
MIVSHDSLVNQFSKMLDAGTLSRVRIDHYCKTYDCQPDDINNAINEVMVRRSSPDQGFGGDK